MVDFNCFRDKIKSKYKKKMTFDEYIFTGLNMLSSMIEYERQDNAEKIAHIEDRTIELILRTNGNIIWSKDKNDILQCGFGYDGGILDVNGVGRTLSGNMLNGYGLKGTNGINAVLGYNNSTRTPDLMIYKFAELLTELDISELNAIIFSREFPIFESETSGIAEQIKTYYKRLEQGEPLTISKKNKSLVGNESDVIKQLNITDPTRVNKLEFIEQMHNSLLRRAFTMYGQALAEGTKQAQQSIDEISANVSSSFIIPFDNMKARKKMCDNIYNVFGVRLIPKLSEPWCVELEKWERERTNTEHVEISDNI